MYWEGTAAFQIAACAREHSTADRRTFLFAFVFVTIIKESLDLGM